MIPPHAPRRSARSWRRWTRPRRGAPHSRTGPRPPRRSPWRNGDRFPKLAFTLNWEAHTLTCPHQQTLPFALGATVHVPAAVCAACPLRERCTTSATGRSVSIHPDERLLVAFRERQATP